MEIEPRDKSGKGRAGERDREGLILEEQRKPPGR
jgi:hypothetical protein